jgi:hypothetical protein
MKVAQTKQAAAVAKKNTPFFTKDASQGFFNSASKKNDAFFKGKNSHSPVQTKLDIGKPDDHYEKEADTMADKVVQRLSESPDIQKKPLGPITPLIQTKCAECEKEDKLQKKETDSNKDKIQQKPIFENSEMTDFSGNLNTGSQGKKNIQKKAIFESNEPIADRTIQRKANTENTSIKKGVENHGGISAGKNIGIESNGRVIQQKSVEQEIRKEKEEERNIGKEKVQKKPIFESNAVPPDDEKNIQRKCAECEKEEQLQKKNDSSHPSKSSSNIESSLNASKSSGSHLPQNTKQEMESSFGTDFSNVRIHDDTTAEQMSKDLNAQAFTHGSDIYFSSGKYDINSTAGKHLLAHELTHTVQQNPRLNKNQQPQISAKIQLQGNPAASGGGGSGTGLTADGAIDGSNVVLKNFPLKQYSFNGKIINAPASLIEGQKQAILGVGDRKTNQNTAWKNMVKDGVKESLLDRVATEGLNKDKNIIVKRNNKPILPLGKAVDLAERDELINPKWNIQGKDEINEIEHKIDALIAGNDKADKPENLMLLDKKTNRHIGSGHVRSLIKNSVDKVLKNDPNKDTLKNETFASLQKSGRVIISNGTNRDKVDPTSVWEKDDFSKSNLTNETNPLSKKYLEVVSAIVPKGSFILKAKSNALGYIVKYSEKNSFIELKPDKQENPTKIDATIKQYFEKGKGKAAGVFKNTPEQTIPLVQDTKDPQEWVLNMPELDDALNVKFLSPVELDKNSIDFNPYSGLEAKGKVKSDIPILREADISFKAGGSDFTISASISTDYLSNKFPKPFSIDYSTFEISASTEEGLSVGGEIGFSIKKIGDGSLNAGIGKDGFSLEGNFNFDSKLFQRAAIRFSYIKNQWEIGGDLELKENALKGIKSGSLSVNYANNIVQAQGTAVPAIKGFKEIQLGLSAGPEGFEIDGGIEVEKLPGIKSGKGNVKIIKKDDDYSFEGAGKILPDVPGIESEIDFTINNGLFTVDVNINYNHNRLSGSLHLGITNEGVGDDGKPNNKISDSISFYGGGSLGLEITENLKATAGVNILRNGEIEVTGKIELPKAFQLFPAPLPKVEKDLIPIPAIHIPIFAIPLGVANIGLEATIAPHVKAEAEIGAGQLTNVFAEIKYNPAKPDEMTITGGADFEMRVYAMIKVGVDLDLGLSVGVASISGGIGLNAGVILEAKQPLLHTELKWSPKSGFDFQGLAQVVISPKLFFSGDAHVKAHVVLLGDYTLIEKQLVNKEFDPGLDFGMKLPFHYQQGQPFKLSFSDIEFVYPKFDGQTLNKLKDSIVVPLKQEFTSN